MKHGGPLARGLSLAHVRAPMQRQPWGQDARLQLSSNAGSAPSSRLPFATIRSAPSSNGR